MKWSVQDKRTGRFVPTVGEWSDKRGYIYVNISTLQDPHLRDLCRESVLNRSYGKRRSGAIYKHHIEMIKKVLRPLVKGEAIHHIDGDPGNNDPSNLILLSQKEHLKDYRELAYENKRLKDILDLHKISYK